MKKMILVPATSVTSPVDTQISTLDSEMSSILEKPISVKSKLRQYLDTLQKYLSLKSIQQQPPTVQVSNFPPPSNFNFQPAPAPNPQTPLSNNEIQRLTPLQADISGHRNLLPINFNLQTPQASYATPLVNRRKTQFFPATSKTPPRQKPTERPGLGKNTTKRTKTPQPPARHNTVRSRAEREAPTTDKSTSAKSQETRTRKPQNRFGDWVE